MRRMDKLPVEGFGGRAPSGGCISLESVAFYFRPTKGLGLILPEGYL